MTDHTNLEEGWFGSSPTNGRWPAATAIVLLAMLLVPYSADCQPEAGHPLPIIDMHVHVFGTGSTPSADEKAALERMASAMRAANVARAIVGGPSEYLSVLRRVLPETVIPSEVFPLPFDKPQWPDVNKLRAEHAAGRIGALGEVLAQLHGLPPTDSRLEP